MELTSAPAELDDWANENNASYKPIGNKILISIDSIVSLTASGKRTKVISKEISTNQQNVEYRVMETYDYIKEFIRNFHESPNEPYNKDKHKLNLEYCIRKKLGQDFADYNDFITFKKNDNSNDERPKHLRFEFNVQDEGDDDGGNEKIIQLFNLPVHARPSSEWNVTQKDKYDHYITFHKGTPQLTAQPLLAIRENFQDANHKVVTQYGGWGTVEIVADLIERFNVSIIEN